MPSLLPSSFPQFYLTYYLLQITSVVLAYVIAAVSPVMEVAIFGLPSYMCMQARDGLPGRRI